MSDTSVNLHKEIFTTFEVAKVCNANITSIKNWIEKGKLRAFRTPGGHYRIEKAVLTDFLDRYSMPNPFVDRSRKSVLVLGTDPGTVELVRRSLGRDSDVSGTDDPFEAALLIGDIKPDCFVVDLQMKNMDGLHMVTKIRENHHFKRMAIVAYTDNDDLNFEHDARDKGVNQFVRASDGIEALNDKVKESLV